MSVHNIKQRLKKLEVIHHLHTHPVQVQIVRHSDAPLPEPHQHNNVRVTYVRAPTPEEPHGR
jgi:hypothetical protein